MHESDALFITGLTPDGYELFDRIFRSFARIERHQRRMMRLLGDIQHGDDEEFAIVSQELDDLKREVQESKSVTEGAATLIQSLADRILENKDDPAALEQLAQDLDAQSQQLAAAVQANTPIQPSGNP
jgi:chromosome segregation ATPase